MLCLVVRDFFRNCGRLLRRHFSNLSLIVNGFQTPLAFLSGLISMAQSGVFIRINYSEKEESLTFMQFHPQESLVIRVDENDLTLSHTFSVIGNHSKFKIHVPVECWLDFGVQHLFHTKLFTTE